LPAQAFELQQRRRTGRPGQFFGGQACFVGDIGAQGVQRGATQVQASGQGRFHAHVEPAFDRARDELVRHGVDQQPGQHAHQADDGGQLDQQATAELAAPEAQDQPRRQPENDQQQHTGHGGVDGQQPAEVQLVQRAVAGGLGQQEQQHQTDAAHEQQRRHHRPAHGSGLVAPGL
jgi:type IV secretory pathway VirB10-like protein